MINVEIYKVYSEYNYLPFEFRKSLNCIEEFTILSHFLWISLSSGDKQNFGSAESLVTNVFLSKIFNISINLD